MEELNKRIMKLREKIEKKREAYITLMDNAKKKRHISCFTQKR